MIEWVLKNNFEKNWLEALYQMRCASWYHLCNLKNVKSTHGEVLFLVVTLLHGCFSRFLS